MYDYELQNYLSQRRNLISSKEYLYICNTCPQLNHVKYDPFKDCFEAWSDQGNYFRFKVYLEND